VGLLGASGELALVGDAAERAAVGAQDEGQVGEDGVVYRRGESK
jgi:hypothetical protein